MDVAVRREVADPSWRSVPIPADEPVATTARVLIGEDDADMRSLIAAMLRSDGYRVVEAANGAEVLEQIEATITGPLRDRFRAVITDIEMPALTGLDVLAALRCAKWRTPIIFITAFGNPDIRAEADWLGALAVLDKPFRPDALRGAVRKALALPSGACAAA